ncbi:MAG: DUF4342 domain-containing protein [Longimicrobiales bacterium]
MSDESGGTATTGLTPTRNQNREEYRVKGEQLLSKVKELLHEGNIRRVIIKNDDGRTLIEIPLTIGVAAAVLVPVWAALGAVAALVTNCSIVVERDPE